MGFYDTFTRVNPGDTLAYLKISEHRNRNNPPLRWLHTEHGLRLRLRFTTTSRYVEIHTGCNSRFRKRFFQFITVNGWVKIGLTFPDNRTACRAQWFKSGLGKFCMAIRKQLFDCVWCVVLVENLKDRAFLPVPLMLNCQSSTLECVGSAAADFSVQTSLGYCKELQ